MHKDILQEIKQRLEAVKEELDDFISKMSEHQSYFYYDGTVPSIPKFFEANKDTVPSIPKFFEANKDTVATLNPSFNFVYTIPCENCHQHNNGLFIVNGKEMYLCSECAKKLKASPVDSDRIWKIISDGTISGTAVYFNGKEVDFSNLKLEIDKTSKKIKLELKTDSSKIEFHFGD